MCVSACAVSACLGNGHQLTVILMSDMHNLLRMFFAGPRPRRFVHSCPADGGERQLSGKARNTIPRISKFLHIERLQGWDEEEVRTDHLREPIGWGICISENRLGNLYNYFSLLSLATPPPLLTH